MIYVFLRDDSGSEIVLIASGSRVAPFKCLTMPQLELVAALVLAGLMETAGRALGGRMSIGSVARWSGGAVVLSWIGAGRSCRRLVGHLVGEVLGLAGQSEWDRCPAGGNPADIGSRGQSR